MCALCGAFGAAEHWTDGIGPAAASPSEAERRRRAAVANEALGLFGLELKAWSNRFTLVSRTGKAAVVDHFGLIWPEAERMTGRPCDPLDEAVLDKIEAHSGCPDFTTERIEGFHFKRETPSPARLRLTTSPRWGEVKNSAASHLSPAGRGRPRGPGEGALSFLNEVSGHRELKLAAIRSAPADGPVVVTVLTGFLGAGKTSLLKRLLQLPELAGAAVLINEFGEVGLDHLLLERLEDDVVLLKSGCVCCTIRGDLKQALLRLHGRRARGEVPRFDRLVIETTGLAEPAPIVATFSGDPILRHQFRVGAIVTVVDAVNGAETLRRHEASTRQAAAADRIVVSKVDLVDAGSVAALEARLKTLNPTAEIVRLDAAAMPSAEFVSGDRRSDRPRAGPWLADDAAAQGDHGAVAFLLEAETPLDWARFGLWLSMLLNRHGTSILRLKGLVEIEGVETPVAVQGVQHVVHAPEHLAAWPDGRRGTRLVLIAQRLDPERVRRSFRAFNGLGEASRAGADASRKSRAFV